MYPSEKRQITLIYHLAEAAFAGHVLTHVHSHDLYRAWTCARPGTGMYSFTVTTQPGRILVAGDVGLCLWQREPDMLPFCRMAIADGEIHYLAENVPPEIETKEWSADVARDWIAEEKESTLRLLRDESENESLHDRLDVLATLEKECLERGEHEFNRALFDSGLVKSCDFPRLTTFTPNFLWCREAMKWFLAHLEEG